MANLFAHPQNHTKKGVDRLTRCIQTLFACKTDRLMLVYLWKSVHTSAQTLSQNNLEIADLLEEENHPQRDGSVRITVKDRVMV